MTEPNPPDYKRDKGNKNGGTSMLSSILSGKMSVEDLKNELGSLPDPKADTATNLPQVGPGTLDDMTREAEEGKQFDGSKEVVIAGKAHETHVFRKRRNEVLILDYNWTDSIEYAVGNVSRYTNLAMNPPERVQPTGDEQFDVRIQKILATPIPKSSTYPIKHEDIVTLSITGCVYIAPDTENASGEKTPGEKTPVALAQEYNEIKVPFYRIIEPDPEFSKKNPEELPQLLAEPWAYIDANLPQSLGELIGVKTEGEDGTKFKLPYLQVKDEGQGTRNFPLYPGSQLKVYIHIGQHIDGADKAGQEAAKQKDVFRNIEGNDGLEDEGFDLISGMKEEIAAGAVTSPTPTQQPALQPGNNGTYKGSAEQTKPAERHSTSTRILKFE
ncbi:hypothetical protein KY360_05040 [Candidatus Woesearchaeota archaeon]|nr:hypothetical protein [Candidatus Woesearchaeota archaeon]